MAADLQDPIQTTVWRGLQRTRPSKLTREKSVVAKRWSEVGQQIRAELAKFEVWFVEYWYLAKKW